MKSNKRKSNKRTYDMYDYQMGELGLK